LRRYFFVHHLSHGEVAAALDGCQVELAVVQRVGEAGVAVVG